MQEVISAATSTLPADAEILMILDSPDVPLGTANASAASLLSCIFNLRSRVSSTVVLLPADIFPQHTMYHGYGDPANATTPLDIEQQQLLLSLAHQASYVLATRNLDTGVAKDVSGVIRITRGGRGNGADNTTKDKEYLYLVDANRSVKVWERGANVRS
jgi:elongator complex protein 6